MHANSIGESGQTEKNRTEPNQTKPSLVLKVEYKFHLK